LVWTHQSQKRISSRADDQRGSGRDSPGSGGSAVGGPAGPTSAPRAGGLGCVRPPR
jgi:hypothetical protein